MPTKSLEEDLVKLGPRWTIQDGELWLDLRGPMTRTGQVAAFAGQLADELGHHPTIKLEYAGLTLNIHTHDVDAITDKDTVYANRLEDWLRTHGWA